MKTPPLGEARLLYHLGLIDHLPVPVGAEEEDDDELEEVGSISVAEFLEQAANAQAEE